MSPTDDRDRRLAELMSAAVDPIEPADRLADIRRELHRTTPHDKEKTMAARRPWTYALLGAVGTAAVIGAIAFAGGQLGADDGPVPNDPATSSPTPSETTEPSESPDGTATSDPSETVSPAPETALGIYYVGDTERAGPRLYREFRRGPGSPDGALDLLMEAPQDPDYRTLWPAGSLESAEMRNDVLVVTLADSSYRDRPAGMTEAEAEMAVEQVIWTMQAALQREVPVQFEAGDNPIDQTFGVPTAEPLAHGNTLDVLSHLNITTPEQGATVGDTLELTGRASSFEANVVWEIRRDDQVVEQGFATAEGWMGEQLFPFAKTIDVGRLEPGSYTIWASTDDPTGGTEGIGAMTDSKEFTVE